MMRLANVTAAIASLCACSSPTLKDVIEEDAPGFVQKRPATSGAELGSRVTADGQPAVNSCYTVASNSTPMSGWSNREVEYADDVTGQVKADFGNSIEAEAGASLSSGVHIGLSDVRVASLAALYFNPAGVCSEQDRARYSTGVIEKVLTRALYAGKLSIRYNSDNQAKLKVAGFTKLEASAGVGSQSRETWEGEGLYFAHYPETIRIKLTEYKCDAIQYSEEAKAQGKNTCPASSCKLIVDRIDGGTWSGQFSCPGGVGASANNTVLSGPTGGWSQGFASADGVGYVVQLEQGPMLGTAKAVVIGTYAQSVTSP